MFTKDGEIQNCALQTHDFTSHYMKLIDTQNSVMFEQQISESLNSSNTGIGLI